VKEDLALMAQKAEMDHEVQMARSDLYKAAKYSIKLHDMLKQVSEQQGLEGWVAAKITKASDYLSSVYHYMEYEMMSESTYLNDSKLEEGVLDFFTKGAQKVANFGQAIFDPAMKAKLQADDDQNIKTQELVNDVIKLGARINPKEYDISKGYPRKLIGAYLKTFVEPAHPEVFAQKNVKQWIQANIVDKADQVVSQKDLKIALQPLAQMLTQVGDLDNFKSPAGASPAPGKVPGMVGQQQAVQASIDYKESLSSKLQSKLKESAKTCKDCGKPTWETLDEAEKQKGVDGKVCWKGYKRMGTKMKGGKRVDNCVPIKKK